MKRLESEIKVMLNECTAVYASKDCNKINDWLENNYKPFRKFWIDKVGEDLFADTWNKINRASK